MVPEPKKNRAQGGRLPWLQFLLLVLLFGSLFLVLDTTGPTSQGFEQPIREALLNSLRNLPARMFSFLPMITGIAVGISGIEVCPRKTALRLVVTATVLMVVMDFLAPPTRPLSLDTPALLPSGEVVAVPVAQVESGGSIRALVSVLAERDPQISEVRDSYPPAHPRRLLAHRLTDVIRLGLPLILAGLALGMVGWIHQRVRFPNPRDGRVAVLLLTWLGIPAASWAASRLSSDFATGALRGDQPLWAMPLAYLPFFIPAAFGWRLAGRIRRTPEESKHYENPGNHG